MALVESGSILLQEKINKASTWTHRFKFRQCFMTEFYPCIQIWKSHRPSWADSVTTKIMRLIYEALHFRITNSYRCVHRRFQSSMASQLNKSTLPFDKTRLEALLNRRFFYAPAFEIYGGAKSCTSVLRSLHLNHSSRRCRSI